LLLSCYPNCNISNIPKRIFSYATKWDFVAYAAGFFASIGAGIVSVTKTPLQSYPDDNNTILDTAVDECGFWYGSMKLTRSQTDIK
jgi:hypothetical protein